MKVYITIRRSSRIVFEGNLEDFQNKYFDNADMETVCDWAEEQGYDVEYTASNKDILQ